MKIQHLQLLKHNIRTAINFQSLSLIAKKILKYVYQKNSMCMGETVKLITLCYMIINPFICVKIAQILTILSIISICFLLSFYKTLFLSR